MANDPINLYDYEARAKLALPHDNWDFIDAGAMDEITTKRNRSAFDALSIRPRFMRSVEERKIATTMLGTDISMPVFVCPAGSHGLAHPSRGCYRKGGRTVKHADDAQHFFQL